MRLRTCGDGQSFGQNNIFSFSHLTKWILQYKNSFFFSFSLLNKKNKKGKKKSNSTVFEPFFSNLLFDHFIIINIITVLVPVP